jgi:undecaprenyl-diphosphatase
VEKQTRTLIAGFVAAAGSLLLFGYLAREVWRSETIFFDAAIRDGVHAWASPRLTFVMRGLSWLGSFMVLVPFGALLVWRLLRQGRRHAAVLLVVASVGAEALDQILKLVFHRARPQVFFDLPPALGYSFPSGHSVIACCFYGVVAAIVVRRVETRRVSAAVWCAAALLALAIGLSRVYLGVHYPSDVLAGYAAAVIWVLAVRAGYTFWLRRRRLIS